MEAVFSYLQGRNFWEVILFFVFLNLITIIIASRLLTPKNRMDSKGKKSGT